MASPAKGATKVMVVFSAVSEPAEGVVPDAGLNHSYV
jgi:hypothetical protein